MAEHGTVKIADAEEVNGNPTTDPRKSDTDGDGFGAGWDVANGGNYGTTVFTLVDYIWTNEAENDKSGNVWPNPNAPDNYKGSSSNIVFDYNEGYGAPGFLFKTQ